ncbi:hypothetical protein HHK36_030368 [Tetracentron sinense]|uniref:Uncharacterized protein n=1 Tax=Tetracentron sinense TaxID=13715 RepID=A0A834YC01_TETSI|nr:hypothetical protein HHK36_030368 [Tetracentron sinense]
MSLRTRTKPATTETTSSSDDDQQEIQIQKASSPPSPSLMQGAMNQTLAGTAHLANLLPTGTLLAFQLLTPIFSSNGSCDSVTRPMTLLLLLLLAGSCFLACFTDTFRSSDGKVYYGLATFNGMWLFDYPITMASSLPDLSKYRLRFIDGVHAVLSVLVFIAVALRDKNVLSCFYPKPEHETQEVLDRVPIGIGLICSLLFVVFPTRRNGIEIEVGQGAKAAVLREVVARGISDVEGGAEEEAEVWYFPRPGQPSAVESEILARDDLRVASPRGDRFGDFNPAMLGPETCKPFPSSPPRELVSEGVMNTFCLVESPHPIEASVARQSEPGESGQSSASPQGPGVSGSNIVSPLGQEEAAEWVGLWIASKSWHEVGVSPAGCKQNSDVRIPFIFCFLLVALGKPSSMTTPGSLINKSHNFSQIRLPC